MSQTLLANAARDCYDVAVGLEQFRNTLYEHRERIVAVIAKLYELSRLFTHLDRAARNPQLEPSFFRVRRDLVSVIYSIRDTNRLALNMFGRTRNSSYARVWEDLNYRMVEVERMPFHQRLELYERSLHCSIAVLREQPSPGRRRLNENVIELLRAQQQVTGPVSRPVLEYEEPLSPSSRSDGSRHTFPYAPEPPLVSPISTSSRETYESSQTSFSTYAFTQDTSHWSEDIFDGLYPSTSFHRTHRSSDATRCDADETPGALSRLTEEGFSRALEVQFDHSRIIFFVRHQDRRARLLFISPAQKVYCSPLTTLKIVRDKSSLKLCHVVSMQPSVRLRLWANLNFATFERMCLFYSTFVAMKRQDSAGVDYEVLLEDDELREEALFAGKVKDQHMVHAVRLLHEPGSDVIRLEASPLRGAMAGVPIWTAFLTTYQKRADVHWAEYEQKGVVTLSALKPAPYVFLSDYEPPRRGNKDWILSFLDKQDGKDFCTVWTRLCRDA